MISGAQAIVPKIANNLTMPAHGLYGLNDGREAPIWKQSSNLCFKPFNARFGVRHVVNIILESDLLGGMVKPVC